MVGPFERRNSLLKTLLFAIVGGVLVGFFELWVWFPSLTSIEASVGAGIAFALVLSVVNHFYGVESGFKMATLMSVAAVEKEIQRSIQRGFFEGNAEYTEDLGGIALPIGLPHRHFAVLVAGPMFRIKSRSQEFAEIMRAQVDHHLGDLVAEAEKAAHALGVS